VVKKVGIYSLQFMKINPTVSVIITTRNEKKNIKNCLISLQKQTYSPIEVIVVDNNSSDDTIKIAKKFTKNVFNKGPERSAQRNYGASIAKGDYIFFLDADMSLSKDVISECVKAISKQPNIGGIIVPEESYGIGFWADCKKLERKFYIGNDYIEAARFFHKSKFESVDGFDESLTGPEDWDLSQRINNKYGLIRIKELIYHNEGKLSLFTTIRKKYYYSKKFNAYTNKRRNQEYFQKQFSLLNRYSLFFSKPNLIFTDPLHWIGMIFMKTCEFAAGGIGMVKSRIREK